MGLKPTTWGRNLRVATDQIPPLVLSEVMRDVDLSVGVGNDNQINRAAL